MPRAKRDGVEFFKPPTSKKETAPKMEIEVADLQAEILVIGRDCVPVVASMWYPPRGVVSVEVGKDVDVDHTEVSTQRHAYSIKGERIIRRSAGLYSKNLDRFEQ